MPDGRQNRGGLCAGSTVTFMAGAALMTMLGMMTMLGCRFASFFSTMMRGPLRSGAMMSVTGPSRVTMLLRPSVRTILAITILAITILASPIFIAMMRGGFSIRTMMTIGRRVGRWTMMMRMTKCSARPTVMTASRRRRIARRSVMMMPLGWPVCRAFSDLGMKARMSRPKSSGV